MLSNLLPETILDLFLPIPYFEASLLFHYKIIKPNIMAVCTNNNYEHNISIAMIFSRLNRDPDFSINIIPSFPQDNYIKFLL